MILTYEQKLEILKETESLIKKQISEYTSPERSDDENAKILEALLIANISLNYRTYSQFFGAESVKDFYQNFVDELYQKQLKEDSNDSS